MWSYNPNGLEYQKGISRNINNTTSICEASFKPDSLEISSLLQGKLTEYSITCKVLVREHEATY